MMTCGKMCGATCRQEFTLEEEEDAGPDTEMETGQLLTLSALSSHSLPVAASGNGDVALQPVSREGTGALTQNFGSDRNASGNHAAVDDEQLHSAALHLAGKETCDSPR